MAHPLLNFILSSLLTCFFLLPQASGAAPVFRFHLPTEPSSLAPNQLGSADVSLLFNNVYRGLYSYSNKEGLKPEGAEYCKWSNSNLTLTCKISAKHRWNNNDPVTAFDYVRAWKTLLSPQSKSIGAELLQNVKNATKIFKGLASIEQLGVVAKNNSTLQIDFDQRDPEFLHKLAIVILVPVKNEKFPSRDAAPTVATNGPYQFSKWKVGSRITLSSNKYYSPATANLRPDVEVLFVEEDLTALNLYESGELTFMRRLPAHFFAKYKERKDFHSVDLARFDYIGFGTQLKNKPNLRRALSLSANYAELKKIYSAVGMPGCPALPEKHFDRMPCVEFNLAEAKKAFETARKTENVPSRIEFMYSKLGGDVIQQGMEWFQGQWVKNLGLQVDLQPREQGMYLAQLRDDPPPIYRKGVGLDRPTCLAALETFSANGPENFLKLNDAPYEAILEKLASESSPAKKKTLCRKGVEHLLTKNLIIPLGRFTYSILASPKFTGWTINELHQLDLSQLRARP